MLWFDISKVMLFVNGFYLNECSFVAVNFYRANIDPISVDFSHPRMGMNAYIWIILLLLLWIYALRYYFFPFSIDAH